MDNCVLLLSCKLVPQQEKPIWTWKGHGKAVTAGALGCCDGPLTGSINSAIVTWMAAHCLLELCWLGKNKMGSANCILLYMCRGYWHRAFQGFFLRSLNKSNLKYNIWNKNWQGCTQWDLKKTKKEKNSGRFGWEYYIYCKMYFLVSKNKTLILKYTIDHRSGRS